MEHLVRAQPHSRHEETVAGRAACPVLGCSQTLTRCIFDPLRPFSTHPGARP